MDELNASIAPIVTHLEGVITGGKVDTNTDAKKPRGRGLGFKLTEQARSIQSTDIQLSFNAIQALLDR